MFALSPNIWTWCLLTPISPSSQAEIAGGIISCCLPVLPKFFKHLRSKIAARVRRNSRKSVQRVEPRLPGPSTTARLLPAWYRPYTLRLFTRVTTTNDEIESDQPFHESQVTHNKSDSEQVSQDSGFVKCVHLENQVAQNALPLQEK